MPGLLKTHGAKLCAWLLSGNLASQIALKWNVTNEISILIWVLNISLQSTAAKETSRSATAGNWEGVD